jgi:SpoVK/Ycf46/Vps4 family AAA+-type ATPase
MRDFKEIERLKVLMETAVEKGEDDSNYNDIIEAIQIRMPHIFVLYGKGGVGKSAFPIHLAGLLEFDVWDFNINAVHSKWVGEGSKQMRETLKKITSSSHLIVRVDEYDRSMGATGESGQGMHHDRAARCEGAAFSHHAVATRECAGAGERGRGE